MALSQEEIYVKVRDVMIDTLAVDEDEVKPESRLSADLGAESIDYLDMVFRLEKEFQIKIPRGEVVPDGFASNEQYVKDGKLTPAGLAQLKSQMPYADFTEFEKNPEVANIINLVTVGMISKYVASKLAQPAA